jgi:cilia- and flagella-associated protein 300
MKRYSFDEFFSKHQIDVFLKDFFASATVQRSLQVCAGRTGWANVGPVKTVEVEELKTSVAHLGFFDKIKELDPPVVRDSENLPICKCFDEMVDGILVSDELRKLLLMEDSEHYPELSDEERKELILHVFKRLVVGGGTCQYEDDMAPYLNTTKLIYKDLVSVAKNPSTKKVEVTSFAYDLKSISSDSFDLFPPNALADHSFCYLVIEPLQRHMTVWYGAHIPTF